MAGALIDENGFAYSVASWDGSQWESLELVAHWVATLVEHNGRPGCRWWQRFGVGRRTMESPGESWQHRGCGSFPGAASRSAFSSGANVYRWNGSAWSTLGTLDRANALALYRGELVAGTLARNGGVARWTGSTWSVLEGGTDGQVYELLAHDDQLYAGGDLTRAGTVAVVN